MSCNYAVDPVVNQPVAFSANYLYAGLTFFHQNEQEATLPNELMTVGRGFYSLGVIVVAPVGILYHITLAAYAALAQACMEEGKERSELANWAWDHLDAAAHDLLAWASSLIGPLLLTTLVVSCYFFSHDRPEAGVRALVPFIVTLITGQSDLLGVLLPYIFAVTPSRCTSLFLSSSRREAGAISQAEFYLANFVLASVPNHLSRDRPLESTEEIRDWLEVMKNHSGGDRVIMSCVTLPALAQKHNRAKGELIEFSRKAVMHRAEIEATWATYKSQFPPAEAEIHFKIKLEEILKQQDPQPMQPADKKAPAGSPTPAPDNEQPGG